MLKLLQNSTEPAKAISSILATVLAVVGAVDVVLITQYPHSHVLIVISGIVTAVTSVVGAKLGGFATRALVSPVTKLPSIEVNSRANADGLNAVNPAPLDPALVAQVAFANLPAAAKSKASSTKRG